MSVMSYNGAAIIGTRCVLFSSALTRAQPSIAVNFFQNPFPISRVVVVVFPDKSVLYVYSPRYVS